MDVQWRFSGGSVEAQWVQRGYAPVDSWFSEGTVGHSGLSATQTHLTCTVAIAVTARSPAVTGAQRLIVKRKPLDSRPHWVARPLSPLKLGVTQSSPPSSFAESPYYNLTDKLEFLHPFSKLTH